MNETNEIVLRAWKKDEIYDQRERIVAEKLMSNILIFRECKIPANNHQSMRWKFNLQNSIPIEWATKIHKAWGEKEER